MPEKPLVAVRQAATRSREAGIEVGLSSVPCCTLRIQIDASDFNSWNLALKIVSTVNQDGYHSIGISFYNNNSYH
jgi:hypothetical protein